MRTKACECGCKQLIKVAYKEEGMTALEYGIEVLMLGNYDSRTLASVIESMRDADEEIKMLSESNKVLMEDLDLHKKGLAEVVGERDKLKKQLEVAVNFINDCAAWYDGPEVNSGFDDPGTAEAARNLLKEIERIGKRGNE